MGHRVVVIVGLVLGVGAARAEDDAAVRDKAKQFLASKHRWSRTAQMATLAPSTAAVAANATPLRANALVYDVAARDKATAAGETHFTSSFFRRVPIAFATTPARSKSELFRTRFAITFLLATGPTHTEKLSTLAADPYAVAALAECASAIPDVDFAALQKKHMPTRESLLVAAARAPNHRRALEEQLDAILRDLQPDPAAKGSTRKMDPDAHAERVREVLTQWVAVLPDDDFDLVGKLLLPQLKTMWGAAPFARDVEALLVLYK